MDFEIKTISSKQAQNFSEYIFPPVLNLPGFSDFGFYIALHDKQLLGMVVVDLQADTPEILSVAVSPSYCNQGIATDLVQGVIEKVLELYDGEEDLSDKQFYVSFASELKYGAVLSKIFTKLGFEKIDSGNFFDITKKQLLENELINNPSIRKKVEHKIQNSEIVSLKNIAKHDAKVFLYKLSEEKEIMEKFSLDVLDEDTSFFRMSGGKIVSCILFKKVQDNTLNNLLVYQTPKNDLERGELLYLLSAASSAIVEKYSDDIRISFLITNEAADNLLNRLFESTKESSKFLIYALDFEDAFLLQGEERFHSDLVFNEISLANMVCNSCKYCEASVLECAKYYQKPDKVVDGEDCDYYEAK